MKPGSIVAETVGSHYDRGVWRIEFEESGGSILEAIRALVERVLVK
jgi:hypothetical protein